MLDASTGEWGADLLPPLGIPTRLLGEIVGPGTRLGPLVSEVARAAGLTEDVAVIAPASHDTASAVAAVPVEATGAGNDEGWCYLSSGTWSLLGVETDRPILSEAAHRARFTNERGIGGGGAGTIRFLKNITGLWLLQGVRADLLARGEEIDYQRLSGLAAGAEPFRTRVDIDDPALAVPGGMIRKIQEQARRRGEPVPGSPGDLARCCLEALALSYRRTLGELESLLGRRIGVIHLVGGGGRNVLLNQMTADATGRRVVVGPYEATGAGNVLVQALGAGRIEDAAQVRRIVADSFESVEYAPRDAGAWDGAADRYEDIAGR
jgi:rhamnulokinase